MSIARVKIVYPGIKDINEIIQTFRRYNYSVLSLHEDDFYLQDLKDRSDYLQKYLDM